MARLFLSLSLLLTVQATVLADTLPRNAWIPDAFSARVSEPGWEFVTQEFEEWVDDEIGVEFESALPIRVFDEGCTWLYTAYITDIVEMNYDFPEMSITPRNGYFDVDLMIDDFEMDFWLEGDGLFCADHYTCWSYISVSSLGGSGRVYLDVVNRKVQTRVEGVNVQVNGYEYDTNFECFIIETIAEIMQSTIEDNLEGMLHNWIGRDLPLQINEFFAPLSQNVRLDLFDSVFGFGTRPAMTSVKTSGATIGITARTKALYSACGPRQNEFRYTPTPSIDYPATVPDLGGAYDAAISISDDAVNDLLYAAYDAGALCIAVDENAEETYGIPWSVTTADVKLLFPDLYALYPDAPLSITVVPQEAPWATIGDGSRIVEGQLNVVVPSVYLSFNVWNESTQAWDIVLRTDAYYEAELLVNVTPKSRIKVWASGFPQVTVEIIDEPIIDFPDPVIERIFPRVIQIVTPILVASLQNFPLPTFSGYGLTPLAIVADGSDLDYLSVYGDLFSDPDPESVWGTPEARWEIVNEILEDR